MNNYCTICKMLIDQSWSELQKTLSKYINHSILGTEITKRCIYCYKNLVELTEEREYEWYKEVMKAVEKRFGW